MNLLNMDFAMTLNRFTKIRGKVFVNSIAGQFTLFLICAVSLLSYVSVCSVVLFGFCSCTLFFVSNVHTHIIYSYCFEINDFPMSVFSSFQVAETHELLLAP